MNDITPRRIGYFVGGFPNTAHSYFYREVLELRKLGLTVDFCSTVRPTADFAPHDWADGAANQTSYLVPIPLRDLPGLLAVLLTSGPSGWMRSLRSILRADVPFAKKIKYCCVYPLLAARLVHIAKRQNWHHIHSGFCNDTANTPLHAYLLTRLPYSISLHGGLKTFGPNQREKWRNAKFGTVVNNLLLEVLNNELAGYLPDVLKVASMGVNVNDFQRAKPYLPWDGIGSASLFFCGRIVPDKGLVELLDATALLRAKGIDAKLVIAGHAYPRFPWFLDRLDEMIDTLNLKPHVRMLGAIGEREVRAHLEDAHVTILPSYYEGLPVSLIESMAMEVPVVATRVGGIPELVRHEIDGLLVAPHASEPLATAIADILSNPSVAASMSRNCRDRVVRHFHSGVSARVMYECLT